MPERAIADTSALIALEKINLLDLLCKIYSEEPKYTLVFPPTLIAERRRVYGHSESVSKKNIRD